MQNGAADIRYPKVVRRVEAVVIDTLIFVMGFYSMAYVVAPLGIHGGFKAAIVVSVLFLLEPGMVSMTGGAIGHHLRGIKVLDAKTGKNLNIVRATLRFFVKGVLGLLSLIFVLVTRRHQAIHDLASRSVVILKNPVSVSGHEALSERVIEEEGYIYPPKSRRIVIIILYNAICYTGMAMLMALFLSDECLDYQRCINKEIVSLYAIIFLWLVLSASVIVFGWRGRLWGARRTQRIR